MGSRCPNYALYPWIILLWLIPLEFFGVLSAVLTFYFERFEWRYVLALSLLTVALCATFIEPIQHDSERFRRMPFVGHWVALILGYEAMRVSWTTYLPVLEEVGASRLYTSVAVYSTIHCWLMAWLFCRSHIRVCRYYQASSA